MLGALDRFSNILINSCGVRVWFFRLALSGLRCPVHHRCRHSWEILCWLAASVGQSISFRQRPWHLSLPLSSLAWWLGDALDRNFWTGSFYRSPLCTGSQRPKPQLWAVSREFDTLLRCLLWFGRRNSTIHYSFHCTTMTLSLDHEIRRACLERSRDPERFGREWSHCGRERTASV